MIAIIKTGGKQYLVKEGDTVKIEKLEGDAGKTVGFDVLLRGEADGSKLDVGTPTVSGAKVEGEIVEQGKSKKVEVVKYKAKSRYTRRLGHRQAFTKVKITKVA